MKRKRGKSTSLKRTVAGQFKRKFLRVIVADELFSAYKNMSLPWMLIPKCLWGLLGSYLARWPTH